MNKNLPPLTKVIARGSEAGFEFERLMKKLLIRDGKVNNYYFEPGTTYSDGGADGLVDKDYPGLESPVLFQFKFLQDQIHKSPQARQIKDSFVHALNRKIPFKTYVLVTPNDISGKELEWLKELPAKYKAKVEIRHFGHTQILELFRNCPELLKYYYGEAVEGVKESFNVTRDKYLNSITEDCKHIDFIGISTGRYQQQQELKPPELSKLYIPLDFTRDHRSDKRLELSQILEDKKRVVVLGDPGSGKSTLSKYIALSHCKKSNRNKIPFVITVRDFVRKQAERDGDFNFIDYLLHESKNHFQMEEPQRDFYKAYLELGKAIIVFDGLDEVASDTRRSRIAKQIKHFSLQYPDTPIWVTSRIVGYNTNVKLDDDIFEHYYLAPVTLEQANEFIQLWYKIQFPQKTDKRTERIDSLQRAIEDNHGVKRLRSNPLLLTMMTLVHQFEGELPDDRAKLYESCIKLLLESWQKVKDKDLNIKNPLEERQIKYDEQLRLLSAVAYYIQNKNQDNDDEDTRGLITEPELKEILFKTRYNKRRMEEEEAREDVDIFIEYIRDRAGLLVERGRNEKKENIFAFVHLSFLEYLCAYRIAKDQSKSQQGHIPELLSHLNVASWEEPILLSLYLFSTSSGDTPFMDLFCEKVFEYLKDHPESKSWLLIARAVRDNLQIAKDDIAHICKKIVLSWIEAEKKDAPFRILKEISEYSIKGKGILNQTINSLLFNSKSKKPFELLFLHKVLFKLKGLAYTAIINRCDRDNLLPLLPVYREYSAIDSIIKSEIFTINHWLKFYNSIPDASSEFLLSLVSNSTKDIENKGFLINSFGDIIKILRIQQAFLSKNKESTISRGTNSIEVVFTKFATITLPLPFQNTIASKFPRTKKKSFIPSALFKYEMYSYVRKNICESQFIKKFESTKKKYLEKYLNNETEKKIHNSFTELTMYKNLKLKFVKYALSYLNIQFEKDFSTNNVDELSKEFERSRTYSKTVTHSMHASKRYSGGGFSNFFSRFITHNFNRDFGLFFSRDFGLMFSNIFNLPKSSFILADLYRVTTHNIEYNSDLTSVSNHMIDFSLSYEKTTNYRELNDIKSIFPFNIEITGPLIFSNIWSYLFIAFLTHYSQWLYITTTQSFNNQDLSTRENIENLIISFIEKYPFHLYCINLAWDFYCKDFLEKVNQKNTEYPASLAAFVISAAKSSMLSCLPCKGPHWEKVLKIAEASNDLMVKISLTFYKLCIFQDSKQNEKKLFELLAQFKKESPELYKLIGIVEE